MIRGNNARFRILHVAILAFILVLTFLENVNCDEGDSGSSSSSASSELLTQAVYNQFNNLSKYVTPDITKKLSFCISDVDAEWNLAFNFSSDLAFLSNCLKKTKGDLMQRLCTAAEIKFYFNSFFQGGTKKSNYMRPNRNCNLTSWVSGCEPGWGCSVGRGVKVDLKNSEDFPNRMVDCIQCCEGFFCPHGLTCMIPCPLGSYCPIAKLNTTTGICDPYRYQLPPGQKNHSCGGADIWADIVKANELFCSAGSYCPSSVKKLSCSSGHFCRTGSVSPAKCFTLATCKPGTANQNITAYGIIIFAGLTLLLLIFYNCSDRVLSKREKKQAKSREAAARYAKETAEAQKRWKNAKDVAKKQVSGLQSSLSRTFSRKKTQKQHEPLKGMGSKAGTDAGLPQRGKDAGQSANLTQMMHDIENDPESHQGFNVEIGDKNIKKQNAPKGKQLHTRSQIFKYAYGQIEKEKAFQEQTKNMTFSGVISMASDIEVRKRPTIEVAFKDLTLTLKGKRKRLLRSVTGKLMPGRVSAVMGPSGAGKTTFLSAVAGKAPGCIVTGMVIINGKVEPIQSYKKIIGFVPQDDIVHGNLTVEENLWFSARCRLSADLEKPEKVLVVERVIESLGLQPVRDSLVGTVEKRGISGGQRKRVNVGLEMVMEPSLLILDEPTSGLDSSSSLLLLRALRREAMEGVNICMVVHQPSYTLFKMFDDLILLAKGGLTAYHGSVKKVEEYFSSLGINVPERVNPPDYFIDVLEGIVKTSTSSGISYKDLPLRWMLHNGYQVPPDMLNSAGMSPAPGEGSAHGGSAHGGSAHGGAGEEKSFAGDLWQDVKLNAEIKADEFQNQFLQAKDLSGRKTPGVLMQYKYFLGRVGKQRLREARIQAVDFLILLLAGICLGTLAKVNDETFGALGYTYTVIAVSLLSGIAALRTFNLDKLHYWRESASGMSSLAYFMAKDTVDNFNTLIKPVVYLCMFYFFNNPRSTFLDNYIILVCLVYCVTGIAYAFAIYLNPSPAQLWSVLLPVVLTLVANQNYTSGIMKTIMNLCYPKWALEAFVISNASRYSGVWLITRCGSLMKSGYKLEDYVPNLIYLIIAGVLGRIFAFGLLVVFQKK